MEYSFQMLKNEYWWGGSVINSHKMPFSEKSCFEWDLRGRGVSNQTMPLLISNKGRYIWSDFPFAFSFNNGEITIEGESVEIVECGATLKDAYLSAMKAHFPFDGKKLPDVFFETAQYNGWMQFMFEPTQERILQYAQDIIDNGFAPGILMIDEGWQQDYGNWKFNPIKFPNPKEMIEKLHNMGFKVMLWVVPYVSCEGYKWVCSTIFEDADKKLFMRNTDGNPSIVEWWTGYSAILDMTKENDRIYMETQLTQLVEEYGIDGFKFDGGETMHYRDFNVINGTPSADATAEERNNAWNDFGKRYKFHEYKDSYRQGGKNMIQRLSDRNHSWDNNGINTIIPSALVQGLLGTPFICPDMIGGGEWSSFKFGQKSCIDQELFVRMAQSSAMLPMMQFSLAPWKYLSTENLNICLAMAKLHQSFAPYIINLVHESEISGEPIIKHLDYEFPNEDFAECNDCFMLGSKYLVAPVIEKGVSERSLRLPKGKWKYLDGNIYEGEVKVSAPIDVLPYFKRI